MQIFIVQRIFTSYRKKIFDLLYHKYGIHLLHGKNRSGISQISTSYSLLVKQFSYSTKETNIFLNIFPLILSFRKKIIIHEFAIGIISIYPLLLLLRFLKIKLIFWGHCYDRRKGFNPEETFSDKLRVKLLNRADALIVYTKLNKEIIGKQIDPLKIFVAQNTIDIDEHLRICNELDKKGKKLVKSKLEIYHEYSLVYIGRMIYEKRPDLLIEMFKMMDSEVRKITCIHFIGDGPMLPYCKHMVKDSNLEKNIIFHGSIHSPLITGEILYVSDLMVMPGYLGLSVNHAFAYLLPVVSFKQSCSGPYHSPEIEYVINNETGFLIDEWNVSEMSKVVSSYLNDSKTKERIRNNINSKIKEELTIKNMFNGFKQAIEYVSNK